MAESKYLVVYVIPAAHRIRVRLMHIRVLYAYTYIHIKSALVVPRAKALTERTTTHSFRSAASDPSELGSEPDS
jgi:hypothetical protein